MMNQYYELKKDMIEYSNARDYYHQMAALYYDKATKEFCTSSIEYDRRHVSSSELHRMHALEYKKTAEEYSKKSSEALEKFLIAELALDHFIEQTLLKYLKRFGII